MKLRGISTVWVVLWAAILPMLASGQTAAQANCPSTSWTGAVFLRDAQSPSFFANVSTWDSSDWKAWVLDDLSPSWIPSAVFLGMALITGLTLLLWRLVTCCIQGCAARKQRRTQPPSDPPLAPYAAPTPYIIASNDATQGAHAQPSKLYGAPPPYSQLDPEGSHPPAHVSRWACLRSRSPWMTVLRVIVAILAIGAIGCSAWGIAVSKEGLASQSWDRITRAESYVQRLLLKIDAITSNATALNQAVGVLQAQVSQVSQTDPQVRQALLQLNETRTQTADTLRQYADGTEQIRQQVIGKVDSLRSNYQSSTHDLEKYTYEVMLVIYSVTILVLCIYLLSVLISCPGLMVTTLLMTSFLTFLFFILPLIYAFILAGGNDLCPAITVIIISFTGPKLAPLVTYFTDPYEQGTLAGALQAAGVSDITKVQDLVGQIQSVLPTIQANSPSPAVNLAADATQQAALQTLAAVNGLLDSSPWQGLNDLYWQVRGFMCCYVPDDIVQVWYAATFAAWCMMVMCWLSLPLLIQYDKVVGLRRCGWVCVTPYDLPLAQQRRQQQTLSTGQNGAGGIAAPENGAAGAVQAPAGGDGAVMVGAGRAGPRGAGNWEETSSSTDGYHSNVGAIKL